LFFFLQSITEDRIRGILFEQQMERQIDATTAISQHIGADLRSISATLAILAEDPELKKGNLDSDISKSLTQGTLANLNSVGEQGGPQIDRIFIVNNQDMVLFTIDYPIQPDHPTYKGKNLSELEHIQETKATLRPVFSKGFLAVDNTLRVAATYPILGPAGEYQGLVGVSMLTPSFFEHYGNIYDIESQYLAVLDSESVQLVHPVKSLVGTPFFGEHTQEVTGRSEALNSLVRNTLEGQSGDAIYKFNNAERLTTGHPVFLQGSPHYFVFVITPTSIVYDQIANILFMQQMETLALLIGITIAIAILIVFLATWNQDLNIAVKKRTEQLEESNRQLAFANERLIDINEELKNNEKAQQEFINIAAHELRTPIQPLMGLAEILQGKSRDPSERDLLSAMHRSARRLQHLADDILDVAKIEGHTFRLNIEPFDLNAMLQSAVDEFRNELELRNPKVKILFKSDAPSIPILADKNRLYQVILNLLTNAAKFTTEGEIVVKSSLSTEDNKKLAVIPVKDTGSGIDPEIMPKLFTKFMSKSERGTGLGLFLSKNIIEAHGGKISASSIPGQGAEFTFTIPLAHSASLT
jgi:signal transduction histidine kinase